MLNLKIFQVPLALLPLGYAQALKTRPQSVRGLQLEHMLHLTIKAIKTLPMVGTLLRLGRGQDTPVNRTLLLPLAPVRALVCNQHAQ